MLHSLNFDQAKEYAVRRLESELSPLLTYHCAAHTTEEVAPAAAHLADLEHIEGNDRLLLLTAAYYHDMGFIYQREGHEAVSIQIAEQNLPLFGYSDNQVAAVREIIQVTHLPQSPKNLPQMVMADADLFYLGGDTFWKRSQDLRKELGNFGRHFTIEEWYIFQSSFIDAHRYFTASARLERDPLKQQLLREIRERFERDLNSQNWG